MSLPYMSVFMRQYFLTVFLQVFLRDHYKLHPTERSDFFWWVISVIPFPDGQGCYPLSASAYGSATIHYVKEEYNTQQINHQQRFTPHNSRFGSSFYSSSPIKISHKQQFFPSQQLLADFHRFFHGHFHKGNGTGQYQYSQQSNTVKTMECFTAQQQAVK